MIGYGDLCTRNFDVGPRDSIFEGGKRKKTSNLATDSGSDSSQIRCSYGPYPFFLMKGGCPKISLGCATTASSPQIGNIALWANCFQDTR